MKQENLPQTIITSNPLAEEMAYAEHPYRQLEVTANAVGLADEAKSNGAKANEAGVAAGRALVANLSEQVEAGSTSKPVETEGGRREISLWASLSPEKAKRAKATIAAMAEKFDVKEDDFALVETEEDGEQTVTAVYAGNGIDLGDSSKDFDKRRSYNAVMAKEDDKNFIVEVDGKKLDTRTGMTEATYRALVADAKARGITLPDSAQMSKENNDVRTWTLLTGESAGGRGARIADVDGGVPDFNWGSRGDGNRSIRFRPVVVIE